jgi:dynein heavy chain 1
MLDEDGMNSTPPALSASTSMTTSNGGDNLMLFDPILFKAYLLELMPFVLAAELDDLKASLFAYPDAVEKCRRFANDPNSPVLYVIKERQGSSGDGMPFIFLTVNGCVLICFVLLTLERLYICR